MRPSQVSASLTHLIKRQRPAFLWGPPGAGKSDVVAEIAKDLGLELRDVRLNLLDPVDLKGFPVVKGAGAKQQMSFVPPDFLPTKGKGILFLDEMNSAPRAVQAAAYQLILNRKIGEYELPVGWAVVAAGNRAGDRAVVNDMPSALANRLVHIDFEVDVDDWYDWALQHGVSDLTRAFIKFRPALLHRLDALHQISEQGTHVGFAHLGVGRVRHRRVQVHARRRHAFAHNGGFSPDAPCSPAFTIPICCSS